MNQTKSSNAMKTVVNTRSNTVSIEKQQLEYSEINEFEAHVSDVENDIFQHIDIPELALDSVKNSANETMVTSLPGRFHVNHFPNLPRSHAALDLILIVLCLASAHFLYLGHLDLSPARSITMFGTLVLLPLSLYAGGVYSTKKLRSLNHELSRLVLCCLFAFTTIGLFAFLTKTAGDVSRVWISSSMIMVLLALILIRLISSIGTTTSKRSDLRNIVLVGDVPGIRSVINNFDEMSSTDLNLTRVFTLPRSERHNIQSIYMNDYSAEIERISENISTFVEQQRQAGSAIGQVWISISENQHQVVKRVSSNLEDSSVDVCLIPDEYAQRLIKGDLTRYGAIDVVNISDLSLPAAADRFKRLYDVFFASLALLILGIPMLIVAALVKIESPGPILFRQKRYGIDGQEIEILKFRSMYLHTDKEITQATRDDSRVSRVGRIIRKTSLDELPQLINVLNGTMSLVGPRPHAVAHNEIWRQEIQGYMRRHKVRPGITGWAQVNGWRGETETAYKMRQRVKYDLEYIRNWSPWLDIKILCLTVFVGFYNKNAY